MNERTFAWVDRRGVREGTDESRGSEMAGDETAVLARAAPSGGARARHGTLRREDDDGGGRDGRTRVRRTPRVVDRSCPQSGRGSRRQSSGKHGCWLLRYEEAKVEQQLNGRAM